MKQEITLNVTLPGKRELKIQDIYQTDTALLVIIENLYIDSPAHCTIVSGSIAPVTVDLPDVTEPLPVTYFLIDEVAPQDAWWLKTGAFTCVLSRDAISIPPQAVRIEPMIETVQQASSVSQAGVFFASANSVTLTKYGSSGRTQIFNRHANLFAVEDLTAEQAGALQSYSYVQYLQKRGNSSILKFTEACSAHSLARRCYIDPQQVTQPLYTSETGGLYVPTGQITVIFENAAIADATTDELLKQGALVLEEKRVRKRGGVIFIFKVSNSLFDAVQIASELQKNPNILAVEPSLSAGPPQLCLTTEASSAPWSFQ